jgi:hypothetical protein
MVKRVRLRLAQQTAMRRSTVLDRVGHLRISGFGYKEEVMQDISMCRKGESMSRSKEAEAKSKVGTMITRGALTDILRHEAKEQARISKAKNQARVGSDDSQACKKNLKNSKCKLMRGRSELHGKGSEGRFRGSPSTSKGMHESDAISRLLGQHGPR